MCPWLFHVMQQSIYGVFSRCCLCWDCVSSNKKEVYKKWYGWCKMQ